MSDCCNLMDSSPLGSSVHGILQARILEWVAISFSRGSSPPKDQTRVSHIAGRFFTIWATREAIYVLIYGICFSLPNLFHSVWQTLGLFIPLRMTQFRPFLWLSNILLFMQRGDSLEKTLTLGKIEGRKRRGNRRWDGWMASSTQWTWVWANSQR